MIKKNSIVWYWNGKEWKKGKIETVNRHYLLIRERSTKKLFSPAELVFPSSEAKPHLPGNQYVNYRRLMWKWNRQYHFAGRKVDESTKKLWLKLGIIPVEKN